ncbi:gamma-glutamylcyclotransferase family protein [Oscillatoria sp. FACHB-1406]|uniref:gamma-glutamylcyclotransferase family protein n=1 Tax=Oscillatoria sp. FACHB-1406 TaxID=2692846 RepID=UPI001687D22A|nr:gamma-glutamylcyclotransferase family protein [Oscillatoria sp. FACHB-1406]MBD2576750.1 gamma-glutamylcyclotransferase [Oscillatoria sp. FACHB-1406]
MQGEAGESETIDIFVYGTLLPGECNHFYLARSSLIADDAIDNAELFNCGAYPMLRPGSGKVYGKCYRVPLTDLGAIDELEEHPNFYYRQWVQLASGRETWTYFGPEKEAQQYPKIPSGSWQDR